MANNDEIKLRSGRTLSRAGTPNPDPNGELEALGLVLQVTRVGGEPLGELFAENTIRAVVRLVVTWEPYRVVRLCPERAAVLFRPNQLLSQTTAEVFKARLEEIKQWVFEEVDLSVRFLPRNEVEALAESVKPPHRPENPEPLPPPAPNQNHNAQLALHTDTEPEEEEWEPRMDRRRRRVQRRPPRPASGLSTVTESESEFSSASVRRPRHSHKAPTLKSFWGVDSKNELSYEHWKNLVLALSQDHSAGAMREAVFKSLKGVAFEATARVSPDSQHFIRDLLREMDTLFGALRDYETQFTALSSARQTDKETVAEFAHRVATLESRIRMTFPTESYPERAAQNLSLPQVALDRVYKGLRKPIRDALRPQFKSGHLQGFQDLVMAAREIEADDKPTQPASKTEARIEKSGEPTDPRPRSVLPNPLNKFFKAKRVTSKAALATEDSGEKEEEAEAEEQFSETLKEYIDSQVKAEIQSRAQQLNGKTQDPNIECFNCKGKGHMARECPSPKNGQKDKAREPTLSKEAVAAPADPPQSN